MEALSRVIRAVDTSQNSSYTSATPPSEQRTVNKTAWISKAHECSSGMIIHIPDCQTEMERGGGAHDVKLLRTETASR